jgi:cation diffusion facilitator family transporter
VERLFSPQPIDYRDAIAVAVIGLAVNLVSAWLLGAAHDHGHGHDHAHGHGHDHGHDHHHDLNLRSAYVHVLADAATSVCAIVALLGGWAWGWWWLDPLMGIAGAILVGAWARRLIADTAKILLDREMDHPVVAEIREVIEEGGRDSETRVADLHVWRVGKAAYSCAVTLVTHDARLTPQRVRHWIGVHEEVVHATIEIHVCPEAGG